MKGSKVTLAQRLRDEAEWISTGKEWPRREPSPVLLREAADAVEAAQALVHSVNAYSEMRVGDDTSDRLWEDVQRDWEKVFDVLAAEKEESGDR